MFSEMSTAEKWTAIGLSGFFMSVVIGVSGTMAAMMLDDEWWVDAKSCRNGSVSYGEQKPSKIYCGLEATSTWIGEKTPVLETSRSTGIDQLLVHWTNGTAEQLAVNEKTALAQCDEQAQNEINPEIYTSDSSFELAKYGMMKVCLMNKL